MTTGNHVRIVHAEYSLRQRGLAFVQEQYGRAFGTTPPDEPDHLFVAYTDTDVLSSTILGTIGISLWKSSETMRLARVYDFDVESAPLPVVSEITFEYGRLIAMRRGISKALIAAASQYAVSIGRTCGWCEHTDAVHRICESFGLRFFPVQATLNLAEIDEGDQEFYRRNPSVRLYMTDTHSWVTALADAVHYENNVWSIQ